MLDRIHSTAGLDAGRVSVSHCATYLTGNGHQLLNVRLVEALQQGHGFKQGFKSRLLFLLGLLGQVLEGQAINAPDLGLADGWCPFFRVKAEKSKPVVQQLARIGSCLESHFLSTHLEQWQCECSCREEPARPSLRQHSQKKWARHRPPPRLRPVPLQVNGSRNVGGGSGSVLRKTILFQQCVPART